MPENVYALPVRCKAGRPRLRPVSNTRTADIFDFPSSKPTLEQQLADYQDCLTQITRGLLMAVRAVKEVDRKYARD